MRAHRGVWGGRRRGRGRGGGVGCNATTCRASTETSAREAQPTPPAATATTKAPDTPAVGIQDGTKQGGHRKIHTVTISNHTAATTFSTEEYVAVVVVLDVSSRRIYATRYENTCVVCASIPVLECESGLTCVTCCTLNGAPMTDPTEGSSSSSLRPHSRKRRLASTVGTCGKSRPQAQAQGARKAVGVGTFSALEKKKTHP